MLLWTVSVTLAAASVCAFGDGLESQHVVQRKIRRKNMKAARVQEAEAKSDPTGPMSDL